MANRATICASARSYLGVPWRHTGRSRAGLDCVGLVVRVAGDNGIPLTDSRAYTRGPQVVNFLHMIRSQSKGAGLGLYKPGQVAVIQQSVFPMHVGIVCRTPDFGWTIIHAAANRRKVVEEPLRELEPLIIELRDFIGLED